MLTSDLTIAPGVLGELALLFATALLLLTYLGAGISALTLPQTLRPLGWLVVPFLGYSLLVVTCALLVAFGANVETSLAVALTVSTIANVWSWRSGNAKSLGPFRQWLAVPALALPSFAVAAVTMAHNGSTAYVGGQADLALVLPLTEWLKTHAAPLFSPGSPGFVTPGWLDSVAPLGGWLRDGASLGSAGRSPEEVQAVFQRGPVYLMSSLGVILGWDAAMVYRPTLAFMLSLSLPATFVFFRKLIGAATSASTVAVILTGLNGTLFFWVAFGHPSQAVTAGLLPVSVMLVLLAVEAPERMSVAAAALAVAALLISYYWAAAPILVSLLAPALGYLFIAHGRSRQVAVRAAVIAAGVVAIALPEHIKMLLLLLSGSLTQVPVADNSNLAAVGDVLGTTLHQSAFTLVAGQGQVGALGLEALRTASLAATIAALFFMSAGIARGRAARLGLFRSMLAGPVVLLVALAVSGYDYGYDKAQASVTFLFSAAIALGFERVRTLAISSAGRHGRILASRRPQRLLAQGATMLVAAALLSSFALSAYIFWKPVGNIWDQRAWEASALTRTLPLDARLKISPNILASPEPLFATLYALRDQSLEGTFSLGGTFNKRVLFMGAPSPQSSAPLRPASTFELLGANEVAAIKGLLPEDRVWQGSLVSVYRTHDGQPGAGILKSRAGGMLELPAGLPVEMKASGVAGASGLGQLVLAFASDSPVGVKARAGEAEREFDVGPGVSVRAVPARAGEPVSIDGGGGGRVTLLAASFRSDPAIKPFSEDYPNVLVAEGNSTRDENVISTHFTYLDIGVLAFHSLDIYPAEGSSRREWFELPTYPDRQLREVQFDLDAASMTPVARLDGQSISRPVSAKPLPDGDYVACFSIWSVRSLVKSIPLYRFQLEAGKVTGFQPFELAGVWNGETIAAGD